MNATSGAHATPELVAAYVTGAAALPPDEEWALEAHLDSCARCRGLLAATVPEAAPETAALLTAVWANVDAAATGSPAPARSRVLRRLREWAPPAVLPWLLMGVLVTVTAWGIDLLPAADRSPSLVLLLAPVAPLLAVAASWTTALDPMGELTVSSPRAGLQLVLRRTAAILVVLLPLLAAAGGTTGVSLVFALLPCLAFTLGSLALGTVLGVDRAAAVLGALWAAVVIAPSLVLGRLSVLFAPSTVPAWVGVAVLAAVVVVVRARAFTRLPHAEPN